MVCLSVPGLSVPESFRQMPIVKMLRLYTIAELDVASMLDAM